MNTLIWQARQWAHHLGAAGLIGLGLLMAALLLQFIQVEPLQRRAADQREKLSALRQATALSAAAPAPVSVNPLDALPPAGTASQQIGELAQLARSHGLQLPRGQYNMTAQAGTSLQRWQLVFPVEASYPDVHAFIAAALERMPNLTLDELKLKRDRIESGTLQAELHLSLFVEAAP